MYKSLYSLLCLLFFSCNVAVTQIKPLQLESASASYSSHGKQLILKKDIQTPNKLNAVLLLGEYQKRSSNFNPIKLNGAITEGHFNLKNDSIAIEASILKNGNIRLEKPEKEVLKKQEKFSRGAFKISSRQEKKEITPFHDFINRKNIFEGIYQVLYKKEKNGYTYFYLYYEHPSLGYSSSKGNCGMGIEAYLGWLKIDKNLNEVDQNAYQLRSCYSNKNSFIKNNSGFDVNTLDKKISELPTVQVIVESLTKNDTLFINKKNIEKGILVNQNKQ